MTSQQAFMEHDKLPPQAIDIEEAVLGSLMMYKSMYDEVSSILKAEIFYREANAIVCQAIIDMNQQDIPVDILTVTNFLKEKGSLELIGGPYYIVQLNNKIDGQINIRYYVTILLQRWIQREAIRIGTQLVQDAFVENINIYDVITEAISDLEVNLENISDNEATSAVDAVNATQSAILLRAQNKLPSLKYLLGHKNLDKNFDFGPNEILLLAGGTGSGKTRFLISLMKYLWKHYNNISTQWWTLEDPIDKLLACFACPEILQTDAYIRGKYEKKMNETEQLKFIDIMQGIANYDAEFHDGSATAFQICSKFRNFCKSRENKFNILIVDNYLLMAGEANVKDDDIMKEFVRTRRMTKGLIIIIHHYGKEFYNKNNLKDNFRPTIDDVKGMESLISRSSQIILFNKPGNFALLKDKWKKYREILENEIILEIAKQRDGKSNVENDTIIRFWGNLDYLIFEEI